MAEVVAGRFVLADAIGRGATGTVWRAYDRRAQRYCAAKLILARDADVLLRVVREQGVRLAHPHVVTPYAWAADDETVIIAMDLVPGGSVTTLIRDHGALPAAYAARILHQLLAGLGHVHAAGLLHRDVKPGNVLLEATGSGPPHGRLGDFGIALSPRDARLTHTGYVVGTPGYLPPEAFAGAMPDRRRDLYAAGVIGWQLMTGAEGPDELPHSEPDPPGVHQGLWRVVRSLLDPDPAARPDSAEAAIRALAGEAGNLPLELPARTPDGELIEVFDQLGPLPESWEMGRTEPAAPPVDFPAAPVSTQPLAEEPTPTTQPRPEPADGPQPEPAPTPAGVPTQPTSVDPPAETKSDTPQPDLSPTPELLGPTPTPPRPVPRPPRWRAPALAVAGLVVVAAIVAGTLFAVDAASPERPEPTTDPTATRSADAVSSEPVTVVTSTPLIPVRQPNADIQVGASCPWQDVGNTETAADGTRVRCTLQPDGYVWQTI